MRFVCDYCDKPFERKRKTEQYFCSRDCWYDYVRENGRPETQEIECQNCGKLFQQKRRRQRFCDRGCFDTFQENMNHGWRWSGGKPSCSICGIKMSFYSKEESPICMGCRSNGHNPWGKDHPNFKGYCTSGEQKERLNTWKIKLLERDCGRCIECGLETQDVLQACHLIPVSESPDLAIDLDNGIILCANCHILLDKGKLSYTYPHRKEI